MNEPEINPYEAPLTTGGLYSGQRPLRREFSAIARFIQGAVRLAMISLCSVLICFGGIAALSPLFQLGSLLRAPLVGLAVIAGFECVGVVLIAIGWLLAKHCVPRHPNL